MTPRSELFNELTGTYPYIVGVSPKPVKSNKKNVHAGIHFHMKFSGLTPTIFVDRRRERRTKYAKRYVSRNDIVPSISTIERIYTDYVKKSCSETMFQQILLGNFGQRCISRFC